MHGNSAIVPFSATLAPACNCCVGVRKRQKKFEVPDDDEREAALGSLKGTPFVLSRVLVCAQAWCEPIDVPCEHDWLSQHDETGQTFDAFRESFKEHRHKLAPTDDRHTIHILPMGNFGHCPQLLTCLVDLCSAFFAPLRCVLLRMHLPPMELLQGGNLEANVALKWITQRVKKDSLCTIALTMVPLSMKGKPAFGLSDWDNKVGIFSLAVYAPDISAPQPKFLYSRTISEEGTDSGNFLDMRNINSGNDDGDTSWLVLLERCCKLVTHEVVHLFGVMHCVYNRCLMNGSNNLTEMDAKPPYLCAMCLRKLHEAIPFAPLERYEKLANFWQSAGFPTTAEWYFFRILIVKQTFAATQEGLKSKKNSTQYLQKVTASHPCQGKFCTFCRDAIRKEPPQCALPDGVERYLKPVLDKSLEGSVFDISTFEMTMATRKMQVVAKRVEQREKAEPNKTLTKLRMRYPQYFGDLKMSENRGGDEEVDELGKAPNSAGASGSRKMKVAMGRVNQILRLSVSYGSQEGSDDTNSPPRQSKQRASEDAGTSSESKESTALQYKKRASFAGVVKRASVLEGSVRRLTSGDTSTSLAPIAPSSPPKKKDASRGRATSMQFSRISISEQAADPDEDDKGTQSAPGSHNAPGSGSQDVTGILKGRTSSLLSHRASNAYSVPEEHDQGEDEEHPRRTSMLTGARHGSSKQSAKQGRSTSSVHR